jgi:hypothetical protein
MQRHIPTAGLVAISPRAISGVLCLPFGEPWVIQLTSMPCTCSILIWLALYNGAETQLSSSPEGAVAQKAEGGASFGGKIRNAPLVPVPSLWRRFVRRLGSYCLTLVVG